MKKANFIFVLVLVITHYAYAQQTPTRFQSRGIPANPKVLVDHQQSDGSIIQIRIHGDAVVNWTSSSDNYTLLPGVNGDLEYAVKNDNNDLVASGISAHNPANRPQSEVNFLTSIPQDLKFSKLQIETKVNNHQFFQSGKSSAKGFPATGNRNLLMILANFSNTTPTYSQTDFQNFMNQTNYNGTGSFKDYYYENSYGQLTITTTVTVWVNLINTHDYYGPQSMRGEFAYDAVVAANGIVDYSQFDNDGDGIVDGVAIIHQGAGQESTHDVTDIWSHSWDLSSAGYSTAQRTFDGVKVDAYTTQAELLYGSMSGIGVMCHEFGHNMGAPDFYDTNYENDGEEYDGTGEWDLMAGGAWNGGGDKPAHHNAFTKIYYYNWASATLLSAAQTLTLSNAAQNSNSFYRYNTTTTGEYYLIENRQKVGFDSNIPGHGMIIYHVDENYISAHETENEINIGSHQGLYPMSAIANTSNGIVLSSAYKINDTGCPWPGTSNKTSFTDNTTPNSKSWANANTAKPITNITENNTNKTVTFCFISCSSIATNAISGSPFCAGGSVSVPYTLTGSVNAGNTFTAELSDANGSFTSPVAIGTVSSTASGTIAATIPSGTPAGSGYRIRVNSSNPAIVGVANSVNLSINALPTQPSIISGQTVPCQGQSENYTVINTSGVSYNWNFPSGWTQTSGGTSNSVTATSGSSGGDISVTPSNTCGNGSSRVLSVQIGTMPSIVGNPIGIDTCAGSSVELEVLASGNAVLFQWKKGGINVDGEISSTLTFSDLQSSDEGSYTCQVYNGCASILSNPAIIEVRANTSIITQPTNLVLVDGQTAEFSVSVSGENLSYQWKKNNNPLTDGSGVSGSQTSLLSISNISSLDAGYYSCFISGTCGNTNTIFAQLSLNTDVTESSQKTFTIFPNPATDYLNIESLNNNEEIQIRIIDVSGKEVLANRISNSRITLLDVSCLERGFYILLISNSAGVSVQDIVIE